MPRIRPKLTISKVAVLALLVVLAGSAYPALASHKMSPTPKPGRYSGHAGPQNINFKVSANRKMITNLGTTFDPATFCSVPSAGSHERFPTLRVHKGRFSGSTSVAPPSGITTNFSIQGRFSTPTRATGKVSGHFTIRSLPPCNATVRFSVKRKGK